MSRRRGVVIVVMICAIPAALANYLMMQIGLSIMARNLILTPIGVIVGVQLGVLHRRRYGP